MANVGEVIRAIRIRRGLTQQQVADGVGIKRSALGNYERGIRVPDIDTIGAFADYFDVPLDDLVGRTEPDENDLREQIPVTPEGRIFGRGIDQMPLEDRLRALEMMRLIFHQYASFFEGGKDDET